MTDQRFERDARLLTPADFNRVMSAALVKVSQPGFVLLASPACAGKPRLGFIVARKNVRHAVDRNRIKRCVRECFRLNQTDLPAMDIVFLARRDAGDLLPDKMHGAIRHALQRLKRKAASS